MGGTGGYFVGIPGNGGFGGNGQSTGSAGGAGTFAYTELQFAYAYLNIFFFSIFGINVPPPPFVG
jgi:hypothetical protein